MRILVTGSSGHLGEGLVRALRRSGTQVVGVDLREGPFTNRTGSIADRDFVRDVVIGVDAVLHAATLHKPHLVTHSRAAFLETNVTGTRNLLEAAVASRVGRFVFTSTTSAFGRALAPAASEPAAWITEDVPAEPKNVYGETKLAAERLCELAHRDHGLPCLVLRTSRFFLEQDDSRQVRAGYADANAKVNEFLYRRVDLADAVDAHLAALERAPEIGFRRYIVTATTPFTQAHLRELRGGAAAVVARLFPAWEDTCRRLGWRMFPDIDRVYVNARARRELGWQPKLDFARVLARVRSGRDMRSDLARAVGSKPYHDREFADGPYPVPESPE
ncbi:MAG: NAD(P)-dependent oxidoreductase [Myxococcota bacterium]|nr:NAD(P)-dependent oxidoreductase [Myxococcota bacterium]